MPPGSKQKILVPLCGKTVDLLHLWKEGHEVVGVEGVLNAVQEFSSESGVELKHDNKIPGRYVSSDGRLSIINGNFFTTSHPELDNTFTAVWDRASFFALSPDVRSTSYIQSIKQLLNLKNFRYLLTTLEYDKSVMDGPPFSIDESEVHQLFGEFATVQRIDETEVTFGLQKFRDAGLKVKEAVYLMTSKNN